MHSNIHSFFHSRRVCTHVFFAQRLLEGTDFGYVPHTSGYHVLYQWIALERGTKYSSIFDRVTKHIHLVLTRIVNFEKLRLATTPSASTLLIYLFFQQISY